MYKINVSVKDLTGFSLSIDDAFGMTDNELVKAWKDAGDHVDESDLPHKLAYDDQGMTEDYARSLAQLREEGKISDDDYWRVLDISAKVRTGEIEDPTFGSIWHQRHNPGGPDEVPTATIARADFEDLLLKCKIHEHLADQLGVWDISDGPPILAENFVEKHSDSPLLAGFVDEVVVKTTVTVKHSYPCLCNIDSRGDGEPCRDTDPEGNHTEITEVYLGDVLAKLGFDIDKAAFDLASRMVAAEYIQSRQTDTQAPF